MVMRKGYFCIMIGMLMVVAFSGCKPKKVITNKDVAYVVVSDNNSDAKVSLPGGAAGDDPGGAGRSDGGSPEQGELSGSGAPLAGLWQRGGGLACHRGGWLHQLLCAVSARKGPGDSDLVFFATSKNKRRVNHVGLYLKNGRFIHASSSKGVIVSDMDESYYRRTYIGSGRVH